MNKLFKISGIIREIKEESIDTYNGRKLLKRIKVEIMTTRNKYDAVTKKIVKSDEGIDFHVQWWGNTQKILVGDVGHFLGDISYSEYTSNNLYEKNADGSLVNAKRGRFNFNVKQFIRDNDSLIEWFTTKFKNWKSGFNAKVEEITQPEITLDDIYSDDKSWQ